MSLQNEWRKRPDGRKFRYAVVGAGWISQEDFMPRVERTGNSVITALVTGGKGTIDEFRKNSPLRHDKSARLLSKVRIGKAGRRRQSMAEILTKRASRP